MAEKCWCGKALVHGYIKDATRDHPAMGCPIHGENWRLSQEQVTALVDAVQASKEFLESRGVQAAFLLQGLHGGASPWRKGGKLIDEILNAALADLVARVEKMEAAK